MYEAWQVISPDDTVPYNWTNGWLAGDILKQLYTFSKSSEVPCSFMTICNHNLPLSDGGKKHPRD